jgi:hypothetical protein
LKFVESELLRVKLCWCPQLIAVFVAPAVVVWLSAMVPVRNRSSQR